MSDGPSGWVREGPGGWVKALVNERRPKWMREGPSG